MKSASRFLATSIQHQVGQPPNVQLGLSAAAIARAERAASGMTIGWDAGQGTVMPLNGWVLSEGRFHKRGHSVNRQKAVGTIREILARSPKFSFYVDMADHRSKSLLADDGVAAPTFCFNRKKAEPAGRILWPLPGYHDLGSDGFLGPDILRDIPWADKTPKLCWRGGAAGWARLGKHGRGAMIRILPLLRDALDGKYSDDDVARAMLTIDRHRFVAVTQDDPRCDVGYTGLSHPTIDTLPQIEPFRRPGLSQTDQCRYKYLAVLPGADVGSSFYWTMNSSSLGFVMDTDYESFASHHFKPWKHYVPLKRDMSDWEENFAWCEANQDACQDMVAAANQLCQHLSEPRIRRRTLNGVVAETARLMEGRSWQAA
ncbi:MAG: glycosyl transferase family 90 [Pseudomonadota bacterium]